MRVRTGKPIILKNLVNDSKFISPTSGGVSFSYNNLTHTLTCDGTSSAYWTYTILFDKSIPAGHKLFISITTINPNNVFTGYRIRINNSDVDYSGNNYLQVYTTTKQDNSIQFYGDPNINYAGLQFKLSTVIDLTETFGIGNEPAAQQFYNAYNKYFDELAAGKEIKISKAGKIQNTKNYHRLPEEYQEVEYIEGRKNAFITTNLYLPVNVRIETKMMPTASEDTRYFGSYSSTGLAYRLGVWQSLPSFISYEHSPSLNKITNIVLNRSTTSTTCTITNEDYTETNTFTTTNSTDSQPWRIFAASYQGAGYAPCSMKLYKHFIYDTANSVLLLNLIPCYRKSDNKPGMYDLVNSIFYVNEGTGEFILGPVVGMKIKSLLGKQNNPFTVTGESAGCWLYPTNNNSFNNAWYDSASSKKSVNLVAGHKYFTYSDFYHRNMEGMTANSYDLLWLRSDDVADVHTDTNSVKATSKYRYGIISPVTSGTYYPGYSNYYSNRLWTRNVDHIDSLIIIDLTEYGLDNLTAQQFYDRYHHLFSRLANGEEVPLTLNCNLRGGTSERLFNYNQLLVGFENNQWEGNECSVSYANDILTVTSIANDSYKGCLPKITYSKPFYSGHKYYFAADFYADTIAGNGSNTGLNLYSAGSGYVIQESTAIPEKTWTRDEKIFTVNRDSSTPVYAWIFMNQRSDRTIGDKLLIKNIFFVDLTEMYGVGNEPITVAAFKQKFPNNYYPPQYPSLKLTQREINSDIYGYNQLNENPGFDPNVSPITWWGYGCNMNMENGEGTFTVTNSSYPACASGHSDGFYQEGRKYLHIIDFKRDSDIGTFQINDNDGSTRIAGNVTTKIGEWETLYYIGIGKGSTGYSHTFNAQGGGNVPIGGVFHCRNAIDIDLTAWFGAGNEPTTLQEFKNNFKKEYYPHQATVKYLNKAQINKL